MRHTARKDDFMKKLTAAILGYGNRGSTYAKFAAENPGKLEIVAVADPLEVRKAEAKKRHSLADSALYNDWREVAAQPKLADFVIISMQDSMHYEPALAFIEKGYNILLEKPMAPTARECKEIAEAAEKKGVKVIVCHVLRFTAFYRMIKDIIDSGVIGDIVSIDSVEGVEHRHQSHSFVRGNWRNSKESSPMILAKSCHDTDMLQWLIDKPCKKVHSFGSLTYFNHEHRPAGAPDYCVQGCPVGDECPYNAVKLYYDDKENGWFRSVAANTIENPTDEEVMDAITHGPYGRCVFNCDNDVVDHQVVNMEFEGGCTVSFTMNAFNNGGRALRIFGTKGEMNGFMTEGRAEVFTFSDRQTKEYDCNKFGSDITSGHGGGDDGIMNELMLYFNDEEVSNSVSTIRTSYMNHLIALAAEESRISGKVIELDKFEKEI